MKGTAISLLLILAFVTSCRKGHPFVKTDVTVQPAIATYLSDTTPYYLASLQFDKPVTLTGAVVIAFDKWQNGSYVFTNTIPFSFYIKDTSAVYFKSQIPQGNSEEVRNVKIREFYPDGTQYNFTIKNP